MYKITLTEFFESKNKLAIHCDTEEKANKLLMAFDKMGKTWTNGKSYLENNNYSEFKKETCYSSKGHYCDLEYYQEEDYIIFEFNEVNLEEEDEVGNTLIGFNNLFMANDCIFDEEEDEYSIRSVTLNEKKKITTVVFADGDVKMVKCGEYDTYSPEMGITYCIALKAMGKSKTQYKKIINKLINKE